MIAMAALAVASIVHWATKDPYSTILKQNWALRPGSVSETSKALFYGVCVAFLGVTGRASNISDIWNRTVYARRVRMYTILYRGYPPKELLLNTEKPDHRFRPPQHYTLFPCVRVASDEHHNQWHERLVRSWSPQWWKLASHCGID